MGAWGPIARIATDVRTGKTKAADLVTKALADAEAASDYDAFISLSAQRAKARAADIDAMVAEGKDPGRLAGVPFIAKDNFLTSAAKTTAASNMLKSFQAPYQATAINRLEAEGAICIAKANLDAFAHGSSTENSDFFVTRHPKDMTRVPGGSSGGSAAAVALGVAPFALGTDTGGSIRLPASFTGVVGYKPSYGLVSRNGVVAMASSTDCVGPLTRSVEDAALVVDVMSGKDDMDSTTIEKDEAGYLDPPTDLKSKRIGLIKEYFEGLSGGIKETIDEAVHKIEEAGALVSDVSLPSLPLALAVYYVICPAEVASNLSRYDGQRYGYSATGAKDLDESYELSRQQGFGDEAKRRIMIGTYVLSSGYYDAYYQKAQKVRSKVRAEFDQAFKEYDLLLGPTAPMTAFKIGERTSDPLQMYLTDIMTVAANISGNPAISLPAGEADGLPVGLQLIGGYGADRQLLGLSCAVEAVL